jgi:parallel beta-helix repeat protein
VALTASASAATIEVTPGPNAINKAIDKAHNGDLLRIHDGTYPGAVTVDKRLILRGVNGRPVIDARCNDRAAVKVDSSGVTLDHLKVVGAGENTSQGPYPSEVDMRDVRSGTVHDVFVRDTCGLQRGAEYGVNVFNSGPVEVTDVIAGGGFSDAGIYIGGITDTGGEALLVARNYAFNNHQGIIIENSSGGLIQVAHNRVNDNAGPGTEGSRAGIFLNNSDRVRLRDNTVRDNGEFGVNISPGSDHNFLFENTITGNPTDVNNQGSANCGSGNTFSTSAGTPLSNCP